MARLAVICSGGDWNDAGFAHVMVPEGMDLEAMHKQWRVYYETEYVPALQAWKETAGRKAWDDPTRSAAPSYLNFHKWLCARHGAELVDVEEFWEVT